MTTPTVGLFIVDTESYVLANNAIEHSLGAADFKSVTVLTDAPWHWPKYRTIHIKKLSSVEQYNKIILDVLPNLMETDYVLVIQYDGFVLHPELFSTKYFEFDYIGAPWPAAFGSFNVGNGGFSWRSRRLVEAAAALSMHRGENLAEDLFICVQARTALEEFYSVKFADLQTASAFSVESQPLIQKTLGFHGVFHLPKVYSDNIEYLIENLPERNLTNNLLLLNVNESRYTSHEVAYIRDLISKRLSGNKIHQR